MSHILHWWSDWLPKDRSTKYRYCQKPGCNEVEEMKVKA